MQRESERFQREKGGIMGEKNVIEKLKQKADMNVTELQVYCSTSVCVCVCVCDNLEITECPGGKSYPVQSQEGCPDGVSSHTYVSHLMGC